MKLELASLLVAVSLFSLAGAPGCAADTSAADDDDAVVGDSEDELSGRPSNFGYYIVTHRDTRQCFAPGCGGFFVKRVNAAKTTCVDGKKQEECLVGSITLGGVHLSDNEEQRFLTALHDGKALVKARLYKTKISGRTVGTLKANEAWLGVTGSTPDGTFFRVGDNGIRCIKAPCPSTTAAKLNTSEAYSNVLNVNLDQTANPASAEAIERAQQAVGTAQGILVAGGVALPKCIAGSNCGPFVTASEFYARITPREGKACGARTGLGCNEGQLCQWSTDGICGAADATGVCAYRPDVCYQLYRPVCGCDGKTYSNDCFAHLAGASVASDGACAEPEPEPEPTPKMCGGLLGKSCDAGDYCEWTEGQHCGAADGAGVCTPKPEACYKIYAPVCGCNGKTYGNDCMAHAAGTAVASKGECPEAAN